MRKRLLTLLCVSLSLLCWNTDYAQVAGNPRLKTPNQTALEVDKSPTRLSPELKKLAAQAGGQNQRRLNANIKPIPPNDALDKYMQIQGNGVVIDITVKGNISSAKTELQKKGLQITGAFGRVISGIFPIASLAQLETLSSVQYARPAFKPIHPGRSPGHPGSGNKPGKQVSPVISQGDTAQRSEIARKKYNVNGKGVKVGILSDSYNNLGTAGKGVKQGELPGPGNPFHFNKAVEVLQDLDSGGTDEGRAMLEIVHDVAPASELAFHTTSLGQANFAQGIQDLANRGCQVIADDALYFAEPFFQDGIIAQSVDLAKKKGVAYFSAAGNESVRSYENDYHPSDVEFLGPGVGTAHNFSAPSDPPVYAQPIYIPPGGSFICSFQWDQSSFSASGVGASSDLDIYLLDINGNVVAGAASDNIASGDPIEVFGFQNESQDPTFFLVILKYAGPDPNHIKYVSFNDALFYLTDPPIPGILAPTLYGHAKAAGAIATAAAFYLQTPAYGLNVPVVEPYSSVGGVANFFDVNGNRIPPLIRKKPDITAPDGGNTSFFDPFGGGDISEDADTYPNFFGTSAAAPHASGVAALMIEAQKLKTITPDQIRGILSTHTSDIDDPATSGFDKGFDFASGYGLIRADKAVGTVKFPNQYFQNLKLKAACSDNPAVIRNWTISNPNPFEVEVQWFLAGTSQRGSLLAAPGNTSFSTSTNGNYFVSNILIIDWQDNFGFTRVDAGFSSGARCGKDAVDASDGQALEAYSKEAAQQKTVAEVYPNPATDNFNLYLSLDNDQPVEIELSSLDGKRLYSSRTMKSNGVISIPASSYRPGMYIIKLKQGAFFKTFKVIKQ
ncbi:MAG TPA: S8 family serine peptidase [Puia sp.]